MRKAVTLASTSPRPKKMNEMWRPPARRSGQRRARGESGSSPESAGSLGRDSGGAEGKEGGARRRAGPGGGGKGVYIYGGDTHVLSPGVGVPNGSLVTFTLF